ncbi:MAG TPA: aspartate aminotransferase family protein, partial [Myxococcota bacterium]|nr:aspartate aminotransferase family protein [Myxococcota bacterium]
AGVPVTINRIGSMFTVFFTDRPVADLADAKTCDTGRFGRFYHRMRQGGVSLPPSQFEAAFLSIAHGEDEIDRILDAAEAAFGAVA